MKMSSACIPKLIFREECFGLRWECAQVCFVGLRQTHVSRESSATQFDINGVPISSAVPKVSAKEDGVHFWLKSDQK